MTSSELKKVLKPLIRQTIKEVLLEEGVLSKVVAEVAVGMQQSEVISESRKVRPSEESRKERLIASAKARQEAEERLEKERQERIKKLNESTGLSGIFEGVKPIKESQQGTSKALEGMAPDDPGVDISGILSLAGGKWKALK